MLARQPYFATPGGNTSGEVGAGGQVGLGHAQRVKHVNQIAQALTGRSRRSSRARRVLRIGEIQAQSIRTKPFNATAFSGTPSSLQRDTFIDDGGDGGAAEDEANRFAKDVLIPPDRRRELAHLVTAADVESFAAEIGIAPGIVVGRLHNDRLWAQNRGNPLRRKVRILSRSDQED